MKAIFRQFARIFGWKPRPKRDFPKWCAPLCHGALNEMRVAIRGKGIKLKPHDITVRVRKADKRYENGWGWYEPSLDMAVGALTASSGNLIEIAIDPAHYGNPNAMHWGSLLHEMAHHWLITNGYGGGHDSKFDGVIPGWREARKFTGE